MTKPIPPTPNPTADPNRPGGAPPASIKLNDGSRLSAPKRHTPGDLRPGQWALVDDKPFRIADLRQKDSGGRLVLLHGRPPAKVNADGFLWIYTKHFPALPGATDDDTEPDQPSRTDDNADLDRPDNA